MTFPIRRLFFHVAVPVLLTIGFSCSGRTVKTDLQLQAEKDGQNCTATREFVTTLEYLRSKKEFQLSDSDARSIASRVAAGCSGAGGRFVKTTDLLSRAGLGSRDSAAIGVQAALKADEESEAFSSIFKRAFLSEYLDLDLFSAIRIAQSLSLEYRGSSSASREDFEKLTDFCVGPASLDLPKPSCATFAQRVTLTGGKFGGGIAKPFADLFLFLRSEKGPGLATGDAVRVAEQVIAYGPQAPENFISAYRYGIAKSGLGLNDRDAILFAQDLSKRTQVQVGGSAESSAAPQTKNSAKEEAPEPAVKKRSRR